jgi:hypothetical protein
VTESSIQSPEEIDEDAARLAAEAARNAEVCAFFAKKL